jgi:hypothetical protein
MTAQSLRRSLIQTAAVVASTLAMPLMAQAPRKSFFTLKLYGVTGVESQFSLKWLSVTLEEVNTKRTVTFNDINTGATHSHFAGEIEPGFYVVKGLSVPSP